METLETLAIVTLINRQVEIKTLPLQLQKAVLDVGKWLTTFAGDTLNLDQIVDRMKTPEICLAIVSCNG
ncbi:MAG: hypothetical protein ACRCTP_19935, partial [Aeromonas popoffii]|uniref:hypothetical protein n=1 Tax=Aeromonas popoffii TaxID=70856 RepID=UPI003F2DC0C7